MPRFTVTKVLSRRKRQQTYGIEEIFVFLVKLIVIQIIFNSKYLKKIIAWCVFQ